MSNIVTGFDWVWMCLARFIEPCMGHKISTPQSHEGKEPYRFESMVLFQIVWVTCRKHTAPSARSLNP